MLRFFRNLWRQQPADLSVWRMPQAMRVYAIGDIHGRLDLFEHLIAEIEADDLRQAKGVTEIILLGDLVDRGPGSAGVINLAREWQARRTVRVLTGNHEEMFLRSFDNLEVLRHFLRHGGRDTLISFGVDRKAMATATLDQIQTMMQQAVPQEVRDYLAGFEDLVEIGDYVFVHAGINPALPLSEQSPQDLRWIREPFLSHEGDYGKMIVHGHTIFPEPQHRANRIGIDTGAYASGRLTALVLEDDRRRYIETQQDEAGAIRIVHRAADLAEPGQAQVPGGL